MGGLRPQCQQATFATGLLGIGVHPISQALQEYPEMAELYDELAGIKLSQFALLNHFVRLGNQRNPAVPATGASPSGQGKRLDQFFTQLPGQVLNELPGGASGT